MVFVKLLITIAICLNLPAVAFAHPGGTDSDGGHINHNTGEYHYHHGYSSHQHSDLDGDGDLDCPYQFVDKTDSSSKETKSFDEQLEKELEKLKKGNANSTNPTKPSSDATSSKNSKTLLDHVWDVLSHLWDILCYCFELFLCWVCLFVVIEVIKKIFRR